jgi:probable phosphoglycerate mutase
MAAVLQALPLPRPIGGVFTSPLGRAVATAEIYAAALGLPVVVIDDLVEIHHGAMAGLRGDEVETAFPGAMARRAEDKYRWRFPEGESYADGDVRAAAALAMIAASGAARPLVVSHEMMGRMLLRNLLGTSLEEALASGHPHGVLYRVDVARRTLDEVRA